MPTPVYGAVCAPLANSSKIVKSAGASKVSKRQCVQKVKKSCAQKLVECTAISQRQIHGRVPPKLAKCSVRTCVHTQCYSPFFSSLFSWISSERIPEFSTSTRYLGSIKKDVRSESPMTIVPSFAMRVKVSPASSYVPSEVISTDE